jgi:hypothetical protein
VSNRIIDLNDILFDQLRRLNDPSVKGDELDSEIERSKAITIISREVLNTGRLALDAEKARGDLVGIMPMPDMLESRRALN